MPDIQVIVNGAKGKMGKIAIESIEQTTNLHLAGSCDLHDDLSSLIQQTQAQVVVDFTNASCVFENAQSIINAGVSPVIGTSGLSQAQIQSLQEMCCKQKIGGLIVPNFAIGAVLMMQFAKQAARYLPNVEIIELHHHQKLDAPSGTASKTAELIAQSRQQPPESTPNYEVHQGARGASYQEVSIHSVRLPGLVAHQEVIFGGIGETLTIRHDSMSRESFMHGIALACQHAPKLSQLHYGLEHILDMI